jgi:hypothetical protein
MPIQEKKMAVTVETLEKLERKITLTLPVDVIAKEVDSRLKRLSRQVKVDGFRPGKVPMNIIGQRYGYQVQYEVMNDKVGEVFNAAATEANLRVAGQPRISEKEGAPEGEMAFDAIFEVFPEVKMPDLSTLEIDKISSEVTEAAIDKTVDILRKQRREATPKNILAAVGWDNYVNLCHWSSLFAISSGVVGSQTRIFFGYLPTGISPFLEARHLSQSRLSVSWLPRSYGGFLPDR